MSADKSITTHPYPSPEGNDRRFILNRVRNDLHGTLGMWYGLDDKLLVYTLEPIVALPAGRYELRLVQSPKFSKREPYRSMNDGLLIQIDREPLTPYERDKVHQLCHIGNTIRDTEGCVLVGSAFSHDAVLDSSNAYKKLFYPVVSGVIESGRAWVDIVDGWRGVK